MRSRSLISTCIIASAAAIAPAAHANSYGGNLSDDTTGPIPAGVHTVAAASVPAGKTLTVSAGAILKFTGGAHLTLDGTLKTNGTAGNPVVLTSFTDDSAGGDTNGDGGASTPAPGYWYGIIANASASASVLTRTEIRYAGFGGYGGVHVNQGGSNFALSQCVIRNCASSGMRMNNLAAFPTVSGCTFSNNVGAAVSELRIDSVPGFTNNTATGNGGNFLEVANGSPTANRTIAAANCLNGALLLSSYSTVPAGVTLTLGPGVVLKFQSGGGFALDGTLIANGTALAPVVLTAIQDDSAGGDTNGDGASSGVPGTWYGIVTNAGAAASVLTRTEIRYAGFGGYGAVHVAQAGSNFTLSQCTIRNCSSSGIRMSNVLATPAVSNCTFSDNGGPAVSELRIDSVPGFTNNSASGNAGNYMQVAVGTPLANVAISAANCLNGALLIANYSSVPAGVTLALGAGVVLKFPSGGGFSLDGSLVASGTALAPVVLTSIQDDSAGGDTNGDGPSSGSAGTWYGLVANAGSAASVLTRTELRYAGFGSYGALHVAQPGSNVALDHCVIRNCSSSGIRMNGVAANPTVTNCAFLDNGGAAVAEARLDSIALFADNSAAGNAGNYISLSHASPAADLTLKRQNCLNGALVLTAQLHVPLGVTLTLEDGVVFKLPSAGYGSIDGALVVKGTAAAPVAFTAFADDTIGGDTNGDGAASVPAPGTWYGLEFKNSATAVGSALEHLLVRYAGFGGYPGLIFDAPLLTARAARVDAGSNIGFRVSTATSLADLTAWSCAADGIQLNGGSFAVRRSTAAGCTGAGIRAAAGYTGTLFSCLAFGNGGGNIVGATAGKLFHSNGAPALAGSNGNIDQNPLFANQAAGDLRLLLGSPCIDKGEPSDSPTIVRDGAGFPRFLDGDLNGQLRADMGAYEYDNVELSVTGALTPGGSMTIDVSGKAGLNVFLFLGVAPSGVHVYPAGALYVDVLSPWTMASWGTVPSSLTFPIPGFFPSPQPLFMQALGYSSPAQANFSNLVDATIK